MVAIRALLKRNDYQLLCLSGDFLYVVYEVVVTFKSMEL